MDKEKLASRLNWFYNLELNQVDLYTSQSKAEKDDYIKLAYKRISYIEQQHIDNIGSLIKKLGYNPSPLGDIITPIIGSIMGRAVSLAGTKNVLKANILIEKKAMKDYKNLIHELDQDIHSEIIKTLQSNLIDEDLHTAWFTNKLSELKDKIK